MNAAVHSSILWQTKIFHLPLVAPVVSGELVIVASMGQGTQGAFGFLDGLERRTGAPRWSFHGMEGMGLAGGFLSTPVVAGQLLVFGSRRGALHCLQARTGAEIWATRIDREVCAAPLVAAGQVFFASTDGTLTALALETGAKRWSFKTGHSIYAAPVVENDRIAVASWDGHLYALDVDGALAWDADLAPAQPTALELGAGRVVMFDSYDGHVRAVGIARDVDRWQATEEWRFPTGGRLDVRPVLADDSVYVAAPGENEMTCLNIDTGEVRWTSKPGAKLLTPVVDNERLIVASRDGQIVALDLRTGIELWRLTTGLTFSCPPALSDDVVYIGGTNRALYAIKTGF